MNKKKSCGVLLPGLRIRAWVVLCKESSPTYFNASHSTISAPVWDISHLGTGVPWRGDICHLITGVLSM